MEKHDTIEDAIQAIEGKPDHYVVENGPEIGGFSSIERLPGVGYPLFGAGYKVRRMTNSAGTMTKIYS